MLQGSAIPTAEIPHRQAARQGHRRIAGPLAAAVLARRLLGPTGVPSILVVDDDTDLREALHELLSLEGFEVGAAADVEGACAAIARRAFDVVLSDICMPGDGATLPQRCREIRPDTRVILMTAFDQPGLRERARADGAVAFLKKPLSPRLLRQALRRALARRS
jgi:CheY-like chemotaxis protein